MTVKRVNNYIFNSSNLELFTEQRIVNIYESLYADCMTKLFKGIIIDAYSSEVLRNSSEASQEIYSLIELAVLTMVNTMPYDDIKYILKSYHVDYINFPSKVRFSMNTLSDDYYRINTVIEELKLEGVNLP